MKLNTGIIAFSLPAAPRYVCGRPDHKLIFSDVRFLLAEKGFYAEDILYFSEWDKLKQQKTAIPIYIFCVGGGADAAEFFKTNKLTGVITDDGDPLVVFSILQSIFLRYNQLESNLLTALNNKAPAREIMNCCAEFFQNQAILYDTEHNLVEYSDRYLPDPDDPYWKEALETGKRSKKLLSESRKNDARLDPVRTPYSDFVDLGPGLPKILTHSFFENGKRLATITIADTNKPLSAYQLKLLDHICAFIAPGMFHIYSASLGMMESLRSVLVSLLNKENVDPLVVTKYVTMAGWSMEDDFLLLVIHIPEDHKSLDTLTRYRHIYERLFPDCIALKYKDSLILVIHNDNGEVMADCMPKLEKQLSLHNAECGLSFPFKGLLQISSQYVNADIAIHQGDRTKKIRYLNDTIANYIVNKVAADLPLLPLCHREAVRVFEYDQSNGTEFLLTLEMYLKQNKSLKAAAEKLFIHRSTMTYRLGCIEKLAHMSLEDANERLHVLLSCIILRNLGDLQKQQTNQSDREAKNANETVPIKKSEKNRKKET